MTRSRKQRATDLLLVLSAARTVGDRRGEPGKVVFHKIIFQAKLDAKDRGLLSPHHQFKRWDHGPYSQELYADADVLHERGLVTRSHTATDRGREIVERYRALLEKQNREFFEVVENRARLMARWGAKRAMEEAYAVPSERLGVDPAMGRTLRELPPGTQFRLEPPKGREFQIDDELLEDLVLDLRLNQDDVRASRRFSRSPVTLDELEGELDL